MSVISLSDMPRVGSEGLPLAASSSTPFSWVAEGRSEVGETSGEVCWKELVFLRMPLMVVSEVQVVEL